jgi:hypothetical protein
MTNEQDANGEYVGLALNNSSVVTALLIEASTNRLEATISNVGSLPTPSAAHAIPDQNGDFTLLALDDNGNAAPVRTNSSGEILADVVIE